MTTDRSFTDPTVPKAPVEVVRAEERLRVSPVTQVRERVRLHKRVVTEEVTRTATVSREVLDIEQYPAESSDAVAQNSSGPLDAAEQPREIEIVLHEERVTLTTVVVPVERIRVRVTRVTDQIEIEEVLRREQVQVEGAAAADPTLG